MNNATTGKLHAHGINVLNQSVINVKSQLVRSWDHFNLKYGLVCIVSLNMLVLACSHKTPAGDPHMHHQNHHGEHSMAHHHFKDAQKWAKAFDDPARDQWQKPEFVLQNLDLKSKKKCIVDIGAGTGYFSTRIAKALSPKSKVYAADSEPDMIEYLKMRAAEEGLKNHQEILVTESFPRLPQKCDMVLLVDTYHHITNRTDYFRAGLSEISQKGRVVIIDFTMESPIGPQKAHRLAKETVVSELQSAGYVLDKDIAGLPHQYFLIFKRK